MMKAVIPAVLLAAALVGATAYAATQGGTPMSELTLQKSVMPPAASAPVHTRGIEEPMRPRIPSEEFSDRVNAGDVTEFVSTKVSLGQAIASAERDMHGKIMKAALQGRARPASLCFVADNKSPC